MKFSFFFPSCWHCLYSSLFLSIENKVHRYRKMEKSAVPMDTILVGDTQPSEYILHLFFFIIFLPLLHMSLYYIWPESKIQYQISERVGSRDHRKEFMFGGELSRTRVASIVWNHPEFQHTEPVDPALSFFATTSGLVRSVPFPFLLFFEDSQRPKYFVSDSTELFTEHRVDRWSPGSNKSPAFFHPRALLLAFLHPLPIYTLHPLYSLSLFFTIDCTRFTVSFSVFLSLFLFC